MQIKKQIAEVAEAIDFAELTNIAYDLADIEKRSSYDDFARSSRYCEATLKRLGFSRVERIANPADGESAAFDCTMPQAWSLDHTRRSFLEVTGDAIPGCDSLLADSTVRPLSANIWSAPTPAGGITAEVVLFDDLKPNHWDEARGKWVLYMPEHGAWLIEKNYHGLAEAGIAGMVAADLHNFDTMPDDIVWYNGNGYCGWYLAKGEKRFPTFSIAPRQALALRAALQTRKVELHGELYCKIYDGEIDTVTAVIPGESDEEIALFAHLYEPFVGDDAVGFAHLAEFGAELIRRKVKLRRTLRVVFSMELYGFSRYLKAHGDKILFAANFDGVPFLESRDILVRRMPFFAAHFTDWFNLDFLAQALPEEKIIPEEATLSDDTFGADPYFGRGGIPTFWLHSSCDQAHHNTGYLFQPDWAAVKAQMPAVDALLENLLTLDTLPDYSKRAARDLTAAGKRILKDARLGRTDKKLWIEAEYMRCVKRLDSVAKFTGQAVDGSALTAIKAKFEAAIAALPAQEFCAAECRALHLFPKAGKFGRPFSLARIPHAERRPTHLGHMVWSLMDGTRSLYECIRMADAEQNEPTPGHRMKRYIEELEYVAHYGYVTLEKREPALSVNEFKDVLARLGVTRGMKLAVHSALSGLGQVAEGVEALTKALQDAVGDEGVLMMPGFTFQVYHPGKRGAVFDVRNTPSMTGILTETFRKMPGVVRSIDPCHSFLVWGKNARHYVEKHHLVPTVDPAESPLALLHADGGYVLTIGCADAVTFMHLAETACGATCCGKREEEYDTLLPNGERVKTRSWSWRQTTCKECPASRTGEIVQLMRQSGELREIELNDARLLLFPLELYRKVYAKLMKKYCRNTARPRHAEVAVTSDWDDRKRTLRKNTDAYTGPWMEC